MTYKPQQLASPQASNRHRHSICRRIVARITSVAVMCSLQGALATADTVSLLPTRDNTLYEDVNGLLSNGMGNHFFAGVTAMDEIRRGLILFDVAGNVPAGATIDSVELMLFASRVTNLTARNVSLHRTLNNWGAASSHAADEEGIGAPAAPGDATWLHASFNSTFWTAPGGDFSPTASATNAVSGIGAYTWSSTAQLVGDVQFWLDSPATNFGWTIVGDESTIGTAKRFDSLEGIIEARRPRLTISFTPEPSATTWNVDADANWSGANNWTLGIPNAADAKAVLGPAITQPRTVTVDTGITAGALDFNSPNAYTIAGPNTLTLDVTSGAAEINVLNGSHTISAPLPLVDNTIVTVGPATSQLSITGALNSGGVALTKAGAGTLTVNHVRATTLSVSGGTLVIAANGGNPGTSIVDVLNVNPGTRLDLNNNDLVVRATAATKDDIHSAIEARIVTAQNGLDAALITKWDGLGITSSIARTFNLAQGFDLTGLGVIRNSDLDVTTGIPNSSYTSFSGQTVTPDDVLVKYTYIGDANLSGAVSFDDYVGMDNAFFGLIPNLGWAAGDINFDSVINFDDYSKVDQAFFFQGAPLAGEMKAAAVPEPKPWLLLAFACLGVITAYFARLISINPYPVVG